MLLLCALDFLVYLKYEGASLKKIYMMMQKHLLQGIA